MNGRIQPGLISVSDQCYLVVGSGVVGQLLLKELAERSVLSLQIKHQHFQLDALLSQILLRNTPHNSEPNARLQAEEGLNAGRYLLIEQSLHHMVSHLKENVEKSL